MTPILWLIFEIFIQFKYFVVTFIILLVISFNYINEIIYLLSKPIFNINELYLPYNDFNFIFTNLSDALFTYIKISFIVSFILCVPLIKYQLYYFNKSALFKLESTKLKKFLIYSSILFLVGIGYCYYLVLPSICQFFIGFELLNTNSLISIQFEAKINSYLEFIINILIIFGVLFVVPLYLSLLLRYEFIRKLMYKRVFMYFLYMLIAIIFIPFDLVFQFLIMIPLVIMHELFIFYLELDKRIEI